MSKNEKVTENKEQKEQTEQKVMTKYDRKVQKRKEEKEKEKRKSASAQQSGSYSSLLWYAWWHLSRSGPIWQPMRLM